MFMEKLQSLTVQELLDLKYNCKSENDRKLIASAIKEKTGIEIQVVEDLPDDLPPPGFEKPKKPLYKEIEMVANWFIATLFFVALIKYVFT